MNNNTPFVKRWSWQDHRHYSVPRTNLTAWVYAFKEESRPENKVRFEFWAHRRWVWPCHLTFSNSITFHFSPRMSVRLSLDGAFGWGLQGQTQPGEVKCWNLLMCLCLINLPKFQQLNIFSTSSLYKHFTFLKVKYVQISMCINNSFTHTHSSAHTFSLFPG